MTRHIVRSRRQRSWTELLAQPSNTSPGLAQTVLTVPPDAVSRELRYDGGRNTTTGPSAKRGGQQVESRASALPAQTGPDEVQTSHAQAPSNRQQSVQTDRDGQGGMPMRGRSTRIDGSVTGPAPPVPPVPAVCVAVAHGGEAGRTVPPPREAQEGPT